MHRREINTLSRADITRHRVTDRRPPPPHTAIPLCSQPANPPSLSVCLSVISPRPPLTGRHTHGSRRPTSASQRRHDSGSQTNRHAHTTQTRHSERSSSLQLTCPSTHRPIFLSFRTYHRHQRVGVISHSVSQSHQLFECRTVANHRRTTHTTRRDI